MRFYALELYAPNTESYGVSVTFPGQVYSAPPALPWAKTGYSSTPAKIWTSHPNGIYDAGAQSVVFDVLTYGNGLGDNVFFVTVEGADFKDIRQHNNFSNYALRLYAGMLPGLPLANNQPTPGLVAQGYVLEGIGNWVGDDMTLTFVCAPDPFRTATNQQGNLVFNWQPGQTLAQALQAMLALAYPGFSISLQISGNLVTNHPVVHVAGSLHSFAAWLQQYTRGALGANYPGVSLYIQNGTILVTDGTVTQASIQLHYTDLIGQPVWADAATMDVMTVLRTDIQAGAYIKLPAIEQSFPGLQFDVPSLNNAMQDYEVSFRGDFEVVSTRQIGDYRGGDGQSWATVIRCVAQVQQGNPA